MKKAFALSLGLMLAAAMYVAAGGYIHAQDNGQRGRAGDGVRQGGRPASGMRQGGRPGGGRWDPARIREMMSQRMKGVLECSDEEWKVIGPRFDKVMELQMQGRFGMMGRRGRPGMNPGENPEAEALQAAIEDADTAPEVIKAKLAAFREAKKRNEAELVKAREALREVLSLRQEARLVLMGTLN